MRFSAPGITIDLPPGWEAEVDAGAGMATGDAPTLRTPRTHVANFALPTVRGDFGSGAVDVMRGGDTLICLLEEDPAMARSRAASASSMPVLSPADFSPHAMQRPRSGQSGTQSFLRLAGGRSFVLYVVLAEQLDRRSQVDEVNRVLASIELAG